MNMSPGAKKKLWLTGIIGGLICLGGPWWSFIILGMVLFIEYAAAVTPEAKKMFWLTGIIGGLICLACPRWSFVILGVILFIECIVAVAPLSFLNLFRASNLKNNEQNVEEKPAKSEFQPMWQPLQENDSQKEEGKDTEEKEEPVVEEVPETPDSDARYEIYLKEIDGFDIDALNKLYRKLTTIDRFKYPKVEDIAGKKIFPELPLILFENLTKAQCGALMTYLPKWLSAGGGTVELKVKKSTTEYPDRIKIKIGSFSSSNTMEFVKVTGFETPEGKDGDYWVATRPVTKGDIELASKQLGKNYWNLEDKSFYRGEWSSSSEDWWKNNSLPAILKQYIEDNIADEKPCGFHIGLLSLDAFQYALSGGQCGSPYKHPGTDNALEFNDDKTTNALGMSQLAGDILVAVAEIYAGSPTWSIVPARYSTGSCKMVRNKNCWVAGKVWFGIRIHAGLMDSAWKYNEKQQQKRQEEQREQQEREARLAREQQEREARLAREQQEREARLARANAAVLRRQKLMQKKQEEQEQ